MDKNNFRFISKTDNVFLKFIAALLLILFLMPIKSNATDISRILSVDAGVIRDNNFSRAVDKDDQEGDTELTLAIAAGSRFQLSHATRLAITADIRNSSFNEYHSLNNISVGTTVSMLQKIGLGSESPLIRIYSSGARMNFRNNLLDGSQFELGIQAAKRFNTWLDLRAGYVNQSRSASNNNVFNGNGNTASLTANFLHASGIRLSFGYGVRHGDITVHNENYWPPGTPWLWDYSYDERMAAYRIRAITKMVSATASMPLGERSSLYIGTDRYETHGMGKSYPNNIFRIGIVHSFE